MRVAIAGYGVEGKVNYQYWSGLGHQVDILDENDNATDIPPGANSILGFSAYSNLEKYDLVVRTAGMKPSKLKAARRVWSATNEFFSKCPAPIIGVTGSKGKGTTSSLIASILRADGRNVHLVGNIGVPALNSLKDISKDDVVVYEMSSFQLWDIEYSPYVAVVLHIEPDHLDVHDSFDEYVDAKSNIVKFQKASDILIVHPSNEFSLRIAGSKSEAGNIVLYGDSSQESNLQYSYEKDGLFVYGSGDAKGELICSVQKLQLPGPHNIENANAAISAALQFNVRSESIAQGLEDFKGLDHRLKLVGDVDGVRYYDDSIATTPGSSMAAVRSFEQPKILILGGSSKGASFDELARVVVESNTKIVILVGVESEKIKQALLAAGMPEAQLSTAPAQSSMSQIVALAHSNSSDGDVVLLSPACASFGQFKNYQDRGDQFIEAVALLSRRKIESA